MFDALFGRLTWDDLKPLELLHSQSINLSLIHISEPTRPY